MDIDLWWAFNTPTKYKPRRWTYKLTKKPDANWVEPIYILYIYVLWSLHVWWLIHTWQNCTHELPCGFISHLYIHLQWTFSPRAFYCAILCCLTRWTTCCVYVLWTVPGWCYTCLCCWSRPGLPLVWTHVFSEEHGHTYLIHSPILAIFITMSHLLFIYI